MEPFIILVIAAALLVVFYVVWSKRSEPTEIEPDVDNQTPERRREVDRSP